MQSTLKRISILYKYKIHFFTGYSKKYCLQFRKPQICSLCKKDLKFKYKPEKSWNITGYLCSDCHMKSAREFSVKQQEEKEQLIKKQNQCFICHKIVDPEKKKKSRWQWGLESDAFLCENCFNQREQDYERRVNFCVKCGKKIGFIRYNPKPQWKIDGQLCRKCWDTINESQN